MSHFFTENTQFISYNCRCGKTQYRFSLPSLPNYIVTYSDRLNNQSKDLYVSYATTWYCFPPAFILSLFPKLTQTLPALKLTKSLVPSRLTRHFLTLCLIDSVFLRLLLDIWIQVSKRVLETFHSDLLVKTNRLTASSEAKIYAYIYTHARFWHAKFPFER